MHNELTREQNSEPPRGDSGMLRTVGPDGTLAPGAAATPPCGAPAVHCLRPASPHQVFKVQSEQMLKRYGSSRVLIIDDDQRTASALSRVLHQSGLEQVHTSTDPNDGLAQVERFLPDLILLDLHMPGLDGFEVLERLHQRQQQEAFIPIVMLTGDGDLQQRHRALAMGVRDFLLKPVDVMEVVLRVRGLLENQLLHHRLAEQNRLLEARVGDRTRELEDSQVEMLQRLAIAAEVHDDETGQHVQRVGSLAARLALALGLSEGRARVIAKAAPLHDLGKIGIPDTILRKPGKLTAEEYAHMREHTVIGARILAGGRFELISLAESIARHHHERWDGAGYPDQLAAEAIPFAARIVAVADVFDALTHSRPYRSAVSVADALRIIQDDSGTRFDPRVVDGLVALLQSDAAAQGNSSGAAGESAA